LRFRDACSLVRFKSKNLVATVMMALSAAGAILYVAPGSEDIDLKKCSACW
jgi:prolyl-tRNA editing enzyme YbaK/EbsC (Cys-tRNA(Pro) deacylase)